MAARMPAFVAADELSWSSTTARCAFGRTGFVPVDLPFLYLWRRSSGIQKSRLLNEESLQMSSQTLFAWKTLRTDVKFD